MRSKRAVCWLQLCIYCTLVYLISSNFKSHLSKYCIFQNFEKNGKTLTVTVTFMDCINMHEIGKENTEKYGSLIKNNSSQDIGLVSGLTAGHK